MISDIVGVTCTITQTTDVFTHAHQYNTISRHHNSQSGNQWVQKQVREPQRRKRCCALYFLLKLLAQFFLKKGLRQDATPHLSLIKKVFRCWGRCWCFDDLVECRGPCFQSWAKGIFDQGVLNGAQMRTRSPVMINMCRVLPIRKVRLLHACFQRDNFRRFTRNECNISGLTHNLTLGLLAVLNIKSNLLPNIQRLSTDFKHANWKFKWGRNLAN